MELKLCALNVGGLKKKTLYPEFTELIKKYHVIGISETKLSKYDNINLPAFDVYYNSRQNCIRNSGGLALLIKKNISEWVTIMNNNSEFIQWCCISKVCTGLDENLYIGNVYLPPEGSKYVSADMWETVQNEITRVKLLSKYVVLMGDFNARTSNISEIMYADTFLCNQMGIDPNLLNEMDNSEYLNESRHCSRTNQDNKTNSYGIKLIEMCKVNNFLIANGRVGSDKDKGMVTSKSVSTIDYIMFTSNCFKIMLDFKVLPFCPMLSDIHSPIECVVKLSAISKTKQKCINQEYKKPRWCKEKAEEFVTEIDEFKLCILNEMLDTIQCDTDNVDKDIINLINEEFSNVFTDCAEKCFSEGKNDCKKKTFKKIWYGPECQRARSRYHAAKKYHSVRKTNESRCNMINKSKIYKRTLNKYIAKHKKTVAKRLRNLRSNDPKKYWSIINQSKCKSLNQKPELCKFFEYFKKVNESDNDPHNDVQTTEASVPNEMLNTEISNDEILKAIKALKWGKAAGLDGILNEYIKVTANVMMPLYVKFFNLILDSGVIPDIWLQGVIIPIYKSGSMKEPENYRPITVLSCIGKLFTSVLNNRLNYYLESYEILEESQSGFRRDYSTLDNIFVLHSLIEILKRRRKKLYCAFIDFSKAYDKVWRTGLWQKLLKNGVNGKFLNILKNMYNDIKSCVRTEEGLSDFFTCECGVRQGENLSPLLFSIYLNDLENYLFENSCKGINYKHNLNENILLKIIVLLYADDTILVAENPQDLQNNLNNFHKYCETWKLSVNLNKTKIVVFGSRGNVNMRFMYGDQLIEIVNEYKYLGLIFKPNGKFSHTIKMLSMQAKKATYALYSKVSNLDLPIDCQLLLFQQTVIPILLYGSEVWGHCDTSFIEKVQNEYMRHILCVRRSTPLYMLYGETGLRPLLISIKERVLNFWSRLIIGKTTKLSYITYMYLLKDSELNIEHKWITLVRNTLQELGMNNIWLSKAVPSHVWFKNAIKLKLSDQYCQTWSTMVNSSTKGITYRIIKVTPKYEHYLSQLLPSCRIIMSKFRTSNHKLPIETGRWVNQAQSERKCLLCDKNEIGDEFHYLFNCTYFKNVRECLIEKYFYDRPNVLKLQKLFNINDERKLVKLCKFLKIIMDEFK